MTSPRPTIELTAEHLILVTQHQQLNILGQIGANQHCQQAEQAPHQPAYKRQQRPAMVAVAAMVTQQNPSSQYEIEFPSGTPLAILFTTSRPTAFRTACSIGELPDRHDTRVPPASAPQTPKPPTRSNLHVNNRQALRDPG